MINDRYSIYHIPVSQFNMCLLGDQQYSTFPLLFTLDSTISLEKSSITVIQNNPNFALFGQGILIGFVDTGIDYEHKAFLNPAGTTRIFSIWDQTLEEGDPPQGFTFGTEFKRESINLALRAINPASIVSTRDDNGHGTMLAGIAAGSPNPAEEFQGVAPEAELVVVKLKQAKQYNRKIFFVRNDIDCYQESDILLGIEYIRSVAEQLNRPLVLCIGVGTSQGGHNGTGLFPSYINNLATYPGILPCIAAGNEGNNRRHFRGALTSPDFYRDFELGIGDHDTDFFFELWNFSPYRLTIMLTSPTGETTQVIYPRLKECRRFNLVFESTILYVSNFILEEEAGAQLIIVRFQQAMAGLWKIRIDNIDHQPLIFDAWLPSGPIISEETFFLESTPEITITNPGNAGNPLTVTAYNQFNDSILINSSRGFSTSGTVVPDLAAPGYQITCPLPGNRYGSATGTGAAAAHASGIIAMLLEWAIVRGNFTTITGKEINRLMIRGATRSAAITYPNNMWGYGQINILGVFSGLSL
ncbi:Subtilase family protein [Lacrimispora sphenoides]|jgi:subtilisin family serine protease|uniref:S8 family peptidase n=1 Tax=Lacrimispora sphenoides TaxID=29370 RepID=UPI0008B78C98|nr:S8 family peptidase [Lacrimispora sphenoides]SEU25066.1 Subtilase family protein [Lacrimispora sphenoides]